MLKINQRSFTYNEISHKLNLCPDHNIPAIEVEVNVEQEVVDGHRELLHSCLRTQISKMTDAADVEDVRLAFPYTSQHRVPHTDHRVAVVTGKSNAVRPRDIFLAAIIPKIQFNH